MASVACQLYLSIFVFLSLLTHLAIGPSTAGYPSICWTRIFSGKVNNACKLISVSFQLRRLKAIDYFWKVHLVVTIPQTKVQVSFPFCPRSDFRSCTPTFCFYFAEASFLIARRVL